MAFLYAPTDRIQGHAQRIFYVHVPMAWLAYLAFGVIFVGSVGYIWKRDMHWTGGAILRRTRVLFTTLVLITGSLWGRPIWSAWWSWEARLTTTLILWFIYLGYFMLREYAGDRSAPRAMPRSSGSSGRSISQSSTSRSPGGGRCTRNRWCSTGRSESAGLHARHAARVCLGFTLLYAYLMVQKSRVETARDALAERELTALLAPEPTPNARHARITRVPGVRRINDNGR